MRRCLTLLLFFVAVSAAAQDRHFVKGTYVPEGGFCYDESKVPEYRLPDVLTASDGRKIQNVRQWEKIRRPELLRLFESEMYGRVPGEPAGLHWRTVSEGLALDGAALRREVDIFFDEAETEHLRLLLLLPAGRNGRVPVFLGVNFFGNHTICDDPEISLPDTLRWRPDYSLPARGSQAHRWPVSVILQRGYAIATFCCEDVAWDHPYTVDSGIYRLYPDETMGALAAWGWGLSRAMDYLQTDPDVDGARVAVFGHSRMGKAALWAAARDRRFAMMISNASGCGGAAISRRRFGETLRRINTHFPWWYCLKFHTYNDKEDELPFDQHELLALIAPRPLYVESGTEDLWSDPRGEELGLQNAMPVYRLYGAENRTGRHVRPGKHEILLYDWERYLDFADRWLR